MERRLHFQMQIWTPSLGSNEETEIVKAPIPMKTVASDSFCGVAATCGLGVPFLMTTKMASDSPTQNKTLKTLNLTTTEESHQDSTSGGVQEERNPEICS